MEKTMTPADREQTQALLQSWYDTASAAAASSRKVALPVLTAAFDASPQFAEDAKKANLVDRLGYDDDAQGTALGRAGSDAKIVKMAAYIEAKEDAATA